MWPDLEVGSFEESGGAYKALMKGMTRQLPVDSYLFSWPCLPPGMYAQVLQSSCLEAETVMSSGASLLAKPKKHNCDSRT